jgi:hypothetical protein
MVIMQPITISSSSVASAIRPQLADYRARTFFNIILPAFQSFEGYLLTERERERVKYKSVIRRKGRLFKYGGECY